MQASKIVVVTSVAEIPHSLEETWSQIGGFADAGRFAGLPCRLLSGDGGLGSVRQIGDQIVEVLVGLGAHSYTYAQIQGPKAHRAYHGCLSLSVPPAAAGASGCTLSYSILYDEAAMNPVERDAERAALRARFQGVVEVMKAAVRSPAC